MATLNLKKFEIDTIPNGSVIMMIGKRNTGKSFLVKRFCFGKRHIPICCAISGTEGSNQFYSKIMPPIFIHDEYSSEVIARMVKRQKLIVSKMNKQTETYGRTDINPDCLIVLDDCLYDSGWTKDPEMRRLFMNGRHHKITLVITSQFALSCPPNLRGQIDYVFLLRENIVSNRKRLYDHFAGMVNTFEIFCQIMDQCTEDYHCLVIDNTTKSNKLEDQLMWYKADEAPSFKMGDEKFWQYSQAHCANDDEEVETDINDIGKKKNALNIQVNKKY